MRGAELTPLRDLLQPLTDLPEGARVWRAALRCGANLHALAGQVLSDAEAAKVAAVRREPARARRQLGYALTRILLADALDVSPEAVQLQRADGEAPILQHADPPFFSVAHSGDLLVLALHGRCRIGVDVEQCRSDRAFAQLAEAILPPDGLRGWLALAESQRERAFYRIWTAKEALLKAHGLTLADGLGRMAVALDPHGGIHAIRPGEALVELCLGNAHVGTLALRDASECGEPWPERA